MSKARMIPAKKVPEEGYPVDPATLANWRWRRIGPKYFLVGRKVFYDAADLDRFFHSNPVLTTDQH